MGKISKINQQTAFEKAVDYIALRSRTEKEIRKYLKDKDITDEIQDEIVAKLYEYRFLDDLSFAQNFIENRRKKWGIKRLKMELKLHGVNDEIISEVLEEMPPQDEEAFLLAQKYLRSHKELDYNKLYAHLASKGFDYESISFSISKIKEEKNRE